VAGFPFSGGDGSGEPSRACLLKYSLEIPLIDLQHLIHYPFSGYETRQDVTVRYAKTQEVTPTVYQEALICTGYHI